MKARLAFIFSLLICLQGNYIMAVNASLFTNPVPPIMPPYLKTETLLTFNGKHVEVHLVDRAFVKRVLAQKDSFKRIKDPLVAFEVIITSEGSTIRYSYYYDKYFLFNSYEEYRTIFGHGLLSYDEALNFYYNVNLDSKQYAQLIQQHEKVEVLHTYGNQELLTIQGVRGLFFRHLSSPFSDVMWFPDMPAFDFYYKIFTME